MANPWWQFSWADVVVCSLILVVIYAAFGFPHGWAWLVVAPALLAGRFVGHLIGRRL